MNNEENEFTCKIGNIGHASLFIIIPKSLSEINNLKAGQLIRMKYVGLSNSKFYPFMDGIMPKANKGLKEEIKKAKTLGFSKDELKEVSRNAEYLYAHLTSQVRNHIFCKSIAAASVYVTGVNMGKKGVTQIRLSELYGISEMTIRSTVHKVWKARARDVKQFSPDYEKQVYREKLSLTEPWTPEDELQLKELRRRKARAIFSEEKG